jgi:iron complex outermembrane recepter protein
MKLDWGAIAGFRKGLAILLAAVAASTTNAAPADFDIPAGKASRTLTQFAQQANIAIVLPYELVAGRRTARIRGRMEADTALQQLLKGTGLAASRNPDGQIIVTLANSATTRVTAKPETPGDSNLFIAETLEELQVTGSRIDATGMTTPTPVTSLSQEELEALSPATLAEALVELPQFLNNDTPQSQSFGTSAAAGASHLNLRGIGSIRTLTLLDGRRVVPATRFGTVDYALLPQALIKRVEVVTGGASAAYGSDAVSGVVNLKLDSRFEGLRARVQRGLSDRNDNGNGTFSLTWGTALGENSHLIFSGEYYTANGVRGYQSRNWFHSWATIPNPNPAGPTTVTARDVHATGYTYGGLITSGPLAGTQFLPGGITAPFVRGNYYTGATQSGGDGVDPAADLIWLQPDQRRTNGFMKFTTDVAPGFQVFAQVLAGRSTNDFDQAPPSLWGPWEATIYADNAFLPQNLHQRMVDQNIASFRMGRMGTYEMASNHVRNAGNLLSTTFGMTRQSGDWQLDAYYQYGRNHNLLRYTDTLRLDRIYRGIDSVLDGAGRVVCRSTLTFPGDGCVPVNIFGEGSVSAAARAYITAGSYEQTQNVTQNVAEATLQGRAFDLPAGPVNIAMGINWRRDAVQNTPRRLPAELDSITLPASSAQGYRGLPSAYVGSTNIFERTVFNNVSGRYAVWELFGETAVPLLSNQPLAESLTLHAAVRYARYSGSGIVPAWKGGLDWQLNPSVRLRLTRSRDVRAGSLSERFDTSSSGTTISDPVGTTSRFYAITSVRTGNPEVEPELGDTWTGGVVLTPVDAPGLSASADYYDIRVHEAITLLGPQNIITRCNAGEQDYCALIQRSEITGLIERVRNLVLNAVEARSRGIDVEVEWRRRLQLFGGDESMALRLFANRMFESAAFGVTGARLDRSNQTGQIGGSPKWQTNMSLAYWQGPLHVIVQQRLISAGRYSAVLTSSDIDDNEVSGAAYTTLRASWAFRNPAGLTAFAHITNLFDRSPPRAASWGFGGSIPTNETLFDVLGRRYVVGLTYRR